MSHVQITMSTYFLSYKLLETEGTPFLTLRCHPRRVGRGRVTPWCVDPNIGPEYWGVGLRPFPFYGGTRYLLGQDF